MMKLTADVLGCFGCFVESNCRLPCWGMNSALCFDAAFDAVVRKTHSVGLGGTGVLLPVWPASGGLELDGLVTEAAHELCCRAVW